jgi:hypothetical protein
LGGLDHGKIRRPVGDHSRQGVVEALLKNSL